MKLQHIKLSELKVSAANVRKHGSKDVDDLIASIRSLGVIQPLLVRPNGDGYEVVAGQRRLLACRALEKETGKAGPVPCAVLDTTDDAAAIEASLAENIARLPMDEIDQYRAFAALKKDGVSATCRRCIAAMEISLSLDPWSKGLSRPLQPSPKEPSRPLET